MSNELVVKDDFSRQLADLDKIQDTCRKLLQTKHYQALGEAGIHGIMARAKALGIHPFEALNGGFICINGKIGLSTEMMAALVRQRGHSIRKDPKSTDECVILHGKRADTGDEWTCTFSKDHAIAAGLWGGATWKKYPGVMLYNRCMSMLFRQLFPDLSLGAGYVEDELKEITKSHEHNPAPLIEAEIEDVQPLYISDEQVKEISEIIDNCDEDYRKKFFTTLKKLFQTDDIEKIPEQSYERILKGAMNRIQENAKKKQEEFKAAMDGDAKEEVKE